MGKNVIGQMEFLRAAAVGDWWSAVDSAPEWPSVVWDERTLRDFVRLLAPGDDRDEQEIAAEYANWTDSMSMEQCFRVAEEWRWLRLWASGDWAAAVDSAKVSLAWPECSRKHLEDLLCHIAQRADDEAEQAAKDIYRSVLFGFFTREQLAGYLKRPQLPQVRHAGPDRVTRQAGPVRQAVPVEQTVIEKRLPKRAVAEATDRHRTAKVVIDPARAQAEEQVVDDPESALQSSSSSAPPRLEQPRQEPGDEFLRDLDDEKEIQAAPASSSKQPVRGRKRANAELMTEVDLSGCEAPEAALEALRREDASRIRWHNKARYQQYKLNSQMPIRFTVYGGGTDHPVLVFEGTDVPGGAVGTYAGSLQVSEKAGGFGAKAGRFFNAKGTKKLSSGILAGTMTVTMQDGTLDLAELTRLLKKSGITDKNLVQR
ncbi:hypothetical protein [Streptomyces sp. NPDC047981]|uniref:hypothetical protein n=1 Tax=Streptomyces sp. NPDC047981 TaxID=3154610 RepID=UPI00343F0490